MRIKKFIASTMQEGREMIERELGRDSIILSNRVTKSNNGISVIEIVAALDEKNVLETKPKNNPYANSAILNSSNNDSISIEINKKLISEVANLKKMVADISESIKYKYSGTIPSNLSKVYQILRDSNISEDFATEIIGKISSKGIFNDYSQVLDEAKRIVLSTLKYSNPIAKINERQIISFIGATGSGKTSSLIKLAIVCKLLHNSKVLIITTDTYKVGGVEQMQTLATISGISFATAYSSEELSNIIKEEDKYDIIMIDTVGINPNNKEDLENIEQFLNAANSTISFLVMSGTTNESSLINSINKYVPIINHNSVISAIVTKVDEATGLGNIVSALNKKDISLGYFTTGQKIPDDIEPADSEKLNDYLFIV